MYGYDEVSSTHAATSTLYIIPVQYHFFCQLTVNKKGAWLSNLMSKWLLNHFRESMYRQLIALEWLTYY